MNEYPLNDPELQSFEARLAARVPRVSPVEQQRLLYECAFAAGQRTAGRSVRRWQSAAAVLGLLLLSVAVPFARNQLLIAKHPSEPISPAEMAPPRLSPDSQPPAVVRPPVTVELDAWQIPASAEGALTEQLAQLKQTDPHMRSLAVGVFARAVMQP
jgi:hypothetical protein